MLPVPPEPMTIHELKVHLDRRFDRLDHKRRIGGLQRAG
jgi:hypothetical protein